MLVYMKHWKWIFMNRKSYFLNNSLRRWASQRIRGMRWQKYFKWRWLKLKMFSWGKLFMKWRTFFLLNLNSSRLFIFNNRNLNTRTIWNKYILSIICILHSRRISISNVDYGKYIANSQLYHHVYFVLS